jgi:hypothetical protein
VVFMGTSLLGAFAHRFVVRRRIHAS